MKLINAKVELSFKKGQKTKREINSQ